MTNYQDKLIEKIESLIDSLAQSDKEEIATGEINDIKKAVRETRQALEKN